MSVNKSDLVKKLGAEAGSMALLYVQDPSPSNREVVVEYLNFIQSLPAKLNIKVVRDDNSPSFEIKSAEIKAKLQTLLEESVGLLSDYPTIKSFKFLENLVRAIK